MRFTIYNFVFVFVQLFKRTQSITAVNCHWSFGHVCYHELLINRSLFCNDYLAAYKQTLSNHFLAVINQVVHASLAVANS